MLSIEELRGLVAAGAIQWKAHCLKQMLQRGISRADIQNAITTGEIIEQYPDDYPFPSCLVLGLMISGAVLHVVCGVGNDELHMVTAYEPDPAKWSEDFRERVKK